MHYPAEVGSHSNLRLLHQRNWEQPLSGSDVALNRPVKTVTPSSFIVDLPQARQSLGDDRGDTIPTGILWHRTILEMPNGDLLAGIYGVFHEDNIPSQYRPRMKQFRCLLLRSTDLGEHWSYVYTIAAGPMGQEGFNEPVIVRLGQGQHEGRLICLMRTGRENSIYQCHSDNDGSTWSQALHLPLPGPHSEQY